MMNVTNSSSSTPDAGQAPVPSTLASGGTLQYSGESDIPQIVYPDAQQPQGDAAPASAVQSVNPAGTATNTAGAEQSPVPESQAQASSSADQPGITSSVSSGAAPEPAQPMMNVTNSSSSTPDAGQAPAPSTLASGGTLQYSGERDIPQIVYPDAQQPQGDAAPASAGQSVNPADTATNSASAEQTAAPNNKIND